MSEHLKASGENKNDSLDLSVEAKKNLERIHKNAETAEKAHRKEALNELGRTVENKAISSKDTAVGEQSEQKSQISHHGQQKLLKEQAYQQTMQSVRRHLPRSEKAFSRVIHQPVVQTVSEITANTVARPSGLLSGAFFALVGSSILLYMARHYGFRYNFSVFLILLFVGYLFGVAIEFIAKFLRKH